MTTHYLAANRSHKTYPNIVMLNSFQHPELILKQVQDDTPVSLPSYTIHTYFSLLGKGDYA